MKILVVEDEPTIAQILREGLEEVGHEVVTDNGRKAVELALQGAFSLIILDIMLPGTNGWQILEEVRSRRCQTPVLMLTARDAVEDRVRGLDAGADDYLVKPFDLEELRARVRALSRRDRNQKKSVIQVADLVIDRMAKRVTRAGKEVRLTRREFTLLEALASRPGQVFSRDLILSSVWMDEESYSNTVDVYVMMLRKKIDAGHAVKLIRTVHGFGYTLDHAEEIAS